MKVDVQHLLASHGLDARKALGQCFLHDQHVLDRIAAEAVPRGATHVVEIGAGLGGLTRALAKTGVSVVAIEKDARLVPLLRQIFADTPRVTIVEGDATALELASLVPAGVRPFVAGNLPYSVSSPLLLAMLAQRERIARATVMLQREVAERLTARPSTKAYGSLTALFGLLADVEPLLEVGPESFTPAPRVDSSVIQIDWLEGPRHEVPSVPDFERVLRAAFAQRRKTLRNSLQTRFDRASIDAAGEATGLAMDRRAETLTVAELAALSRALVGAR